MHRCLSGDVSAVLDVVGFDVTSVVGEMSGTSLDATAVVHSILGASIGVVVLDERSIGLGVCAVKIVRVFTFHRGVRAEHGV